MTNGPFKAVDWKDNEPAVSYMQGMKLLEMLGVPKDQMIESANIDIVGGSAIKLNVVFILSVKQLKQMGIDLNA